VPLVTSAKCAPPSRPIQRDSRSSTPRRHQFRGASGDSKRHPQPIVATATKAGAHPIGRRSRSATGVRRRRREGATIPTPTAAHSIPVRFFFFPPAPSLEGAPAGTMAAPPRVRRQEWYSGPTAVLRGPPDGNFSSLSAAAPSPVRPLPSSTPRPDPRRFDPSSASLIRLPRHHMFAEWCTRWCNASPRFFQPNLPLTLGHTAARADLPSGPDVASPRSQLFQRTRLHSTTTEPAMKL
jgi:hypothetical protein